MKKIAVLFGGTSSEHTISLKTGLFIYNTLYASEKYQLLPLLYLKSGLWAYPKEYGLSIPDFIYKSDSEFEEMFCSTYKIIPGFFPIERKPDICFLGLHGGTGEDGTIQGFLEILGIPYTGSGVNSSSLAMDKNLSYRVFEKNGFHVSPFFELKKDEFIQNPDIVNTYPDYPYFIKPTDGGSSVSTGIVESPGVAKEFLSSLFSKNTKAILQKPINGIEVSCGVIERKRDGNFHPEALFPTEIIPSGDFFDFNSKYTKGGSKEITPARISENEIEEIRKLSVKAHRLLGCSGYSRTDFIIQNGIPYVLETNTLPGMTETSLIPQQVAYQGESMLEILETLLDNCQMRFTEKQSNVKK